MSDRVPDHEGPGFRPPPWATLWLPAIVSFAIQVPVALFRFRPPGPRRGPLIELFGLDPTAGAVALVLAVLGPVALLFARRFPGPVVAAVAVFASIDLLVGDANGPPYVALAFAIVGAVARGARIWAWASIAVCWVATLTIATVAEHPGWTPGRIAATTLGILVVLGIGEAIRARHERAAEFARRARQRQQNEVRAERIRIARELHDVLAHSLSQINVQAGVGLHLLERQPEKAGEALASIKETSKSALDEVRAVLGVLRAENGSDPSAPLVPEPGLDRLPGLVASVAAQGVAVRLDDRVDHDRVPKPVQLAVYRIAQESLTNVQRHAPGATVATVALSADAGELRLEVRDDGGGAAAPASEAGGRGILGMRERAELLGGRLSAGPADGGGFLVRATIPLPVSEEPA